MTLVIDQLTKRFGSLTALDHVDLSVAPGEVYGYLGANGAGKTTTMRIVLGILHPDEGRVTWSGRDTSELPRRTWGYLPEERGLYARMRVLDQLVFFAGLYGVPRDVAARNATGWLRRLGLEDHARRRADELSKGNQQKVQFVAAVLHEPEVLLMDEPFTGLDPLNVALLREALLELRDAGRTIIFSTHQMETVEQLCDSIAIVDLGRIVASGALADVKRSTGRRVVRVSVEGASNAAAERHLAAIPGAHVARTGGNGLDAVVPLTEGEPRTILAQLVTDGIHVTRFEVTEPTVEELFVQLVGRTPDADEHDPGAGRGEDRETPPSMAPAASGEDEQQRRPRALGEGRS